MIGKDLSEMKTFWRGKKVLVTGHTGFKGSWLCHWLKQLGCEVQGISLDPPSSPSLFEVAKIRDGMTHIHGDIRDGDFLKSTIADLQPDIIFHMAAQALVRYSYDNPHETFATNVLGSLNLLEAVRNTPSVKSVVYITTDKCYDNQEWIWPYRENEPLGGKDPYSASKACAEILAASYTHSFLSVENGARMATARAGNVIGGGDWGLDRLVPDMMRAFANGETVTIRNPVAIRPWQHVLEALSGYLLLAEKLYTDNGSDFVGPYNIGPDQSGDATVLNVVNSACNYWGKDAKFEAMKAPDGPHEARYLRLDNSKAKSVLGWQPSWSLEQTLQQTVAWYSHFYEDNDPRDLMTQQISQLLDGSDLGQVG